eukprot:Gregarina_sp_Poly_1__10181@NODE_6_length_24954_cov_45_443846_g5_i0_p5_GENE_NODE_6_length_24954_cov_45_443846_g5_i0NODE_6_length_24954_cov_45_443846_g5_i0_p5_ORF_typecomplete_len310_score33_11_NODE_6_length_24954_cov_45_443846_g5_i045455474
MHRPRTQLPAQYGPPGVGINQTMPRPQGGPSQGHLPLQGQLPPHVIQPRPSSHMSPGIPMAVRNYAQGPQQDVAATQQQVLMLQIGAVATLFNQNQEPNMSYEEYHRKQLENAGVLEAIEECKYREEAMLNLEEAVTQSCLPRLFGLEEVNRSLTIKLFPQKKNLRTDAQQESETVGTNEERYPYPSVLASKWLDEAHPSSESEAKPCQVAMIPLEESIENLILTCTSPMLSLGDPRGRQLRCLRETPTGGFMVAPSAICFLTELTRKLLRDVLTMCLKVRNETPYSDSIDESCMREALCRMGDPKHKN